MTRISDETTLCCPDRIAVAFASLHQARLRHVAAWRRWMAWDGTRWRDDETLLAFDLARDLCRIVADSVRNVFPADAAPPVARRICSTGFLAQVQRLASADRLLAAAPGLWDADPDLLNTPAGIVDTRTGETLPHRPEAFMTRITEVAPAAPGTPCPLWSQWLDRLAGGDADLVFYLQRVAGRALILRGAPQTGRDPAPALAFASADDRRFFIAVLALIRGDAEAAVPESEDDPDFTDRLVAEYPAVLRWAIDGALAWRRIGLEPPPAAKRAATRRREAEDAFGRWLDEATAPSPASWAPAGALYAAWQDWAGRAGIDPGSQKRFSQALEARGFQPKRRRTGQRGFLGLALPRVDDASSVIAASQPSPAAGGRGCERSERVRAGAELQADAPRLPETPSRALTLPTLRIGPLPLPPTGGRGAEMSRGAACVRSAERPENASSVIAARAAARRPAYRSELMISR